MAWLFELLVECGPHRDDAGAVARHFEGHAFRLPSGARSTCTTELLQDDEEAWRCRVSPSGLSSSGAPADEGEARDLNAAAAALYARLRAAPDFRYALVGVEVAETFREHSRLEEPEDLAHDGLVVENAIWVRAGMPAGYEPFRAGYVWRPYRDRRGQA